MPGSFWQVQWIVAATLSELELWLHDRLRTQGFHTRLRGVIVRPSEAIKSGWLAEVIGDFTVGEHSRAATIVSDLQQSFSLDLGGASAS